MTASSSGEPPHDILAAEAFPVGPADRDLHREPAHDILAADAFAVPAPDHHVAGEPAHDVLAADEFAFPTGHHRAVPPGYAADGRRREWWRRVGLVVAGLIVLARLRRRR